MYTCGFRINANLVKEGSFRINAKLVKEELKHKKSIFMQPGQGSCAIIPLYLN